MARSGSSTVAKEVLAYCTSCKMDLNSVVVAMQGDRIAKVQCKTCKKEHVYKAPKGVNEPSAKPAKKTKAEKEEAGEITSIEAEWQKLMSAHKDAPMKTYSMKSQFALGDKLNHPIFGEGIVGKLIYPNKLEVIFRNDIKVLIHSGEHTA
jgi:ribosomal protein L14E/L6E/L27E